MWDWEKHSEEENVFIARCLYEEVRYWRAEFHDAKRDDEMLVRVMRDFLYLVLNCALRSEVKKEGDYLKIIFERNRKVYNGDKKLYIEITTDVPMSYGPFHLK